ncbi:MAG: bifunctional 4-hydroxy-2-oxoglutarate aldolase/2-dehydro-3-deoxy-phosphogluconate aldolase [Pseudomonadota bacterium]
MQQTLLKMLSACPLVPVLVIDDIDDALPLAEALLAGGINIMEITLRSDVAMNAIALILEKYPEMLVGAGTVVNDTQLKELAHIGAHFAISPGITRRLLESSIALNIPLLPGVSNVSDVLLGLEYDFKLFKFFPAEAAGGVKTLKAFHGPFPAIKFCPTGGVTEDNMSEYLALPNVVAIGGSWLAPKHIVENHQWPEITSAAKKALLPLHQTLV